MPEFYTTFARKNVRIYMIIARKNFPDFFEGAGGGQMPSAPPSSAPMFVVKICLSSVYFVCFTALSALVPSLANKRHQLSFQHAIFNKKYLRRYHFVGTFASRKSAPSKSRPNNTVYYYLIHRAYSDNVCIVQRALSSEQWRYSSRYRPTCISSVRTKYK